jgi:hypothetical protein
MLQKTFRSIFLITSIIVFFAFASGETPSSPFFSESWNKSFQLKPTETGDTLTIGAVFSDASELFVNDQAAGAIVVMNSNGKITSKIPLENI